MKKLTDLQQDVLKGINECIREIDWKKIHKVMVLFDWNWALTGDLKVPSIELLKNRAKSQLAETIASLLFSNENRFSIECGGIKTYAAKYEDCVNFGIEFILDSWDCEITNKII